jgi:hypothetical protein|tara:strand:- start:97 stop:420 length:324 start_codon:yes stop_codon:yes gene_type:complete
MNNIIKEIEKINNLTQQLKLVYIDNDITPESISVLEIKYKLFLNNLELISENLLDLISDLNSNDSKLSLETLEYCNNNSVVNKTCKEFYPLILLSILKHNFNDQVGL